MIRNQNPAKNNQLRFLSWRSELVTSDAPYGALRYVQITVEGKIKRATWRWSHDFLALVDIDGTGSVLAAHVYPDALIKETLINDSVSFPVSLLEVTRHEIGSATGLILRHVEKEIYPRIGVFEFSSKYASDIISQKERDDEWAGQDMEKWFSDCKPGEVTII